MKSKKSLASMHCFSFVAVSCLFISSTFGQDAPNENQLVHPEVAAQLGLTDMQLAALQKLLQQRTAVAANPNATERADQLKNIDSQHSSDTNSGAVGSLE